tara:strand:+ start:688 stop:852 length:165 start_codon:yes stop_codon:yes gene_type:complete
VLEAVKQALDGLHKNNRQMTTTNKFFGGCIGGTALVIFTSWYSGSIEILFKLTS